MDGRSQLRLGCGNLLVPLLLQPSCMPGGGTTRSPRFSIAGEFARVSEVRRLRGDLLRLAGRRPGGCLRGACTSADRSSSSWACALTRRLDGRPLPRVSPRTRAGSLTLHGRPHRWDGSYGSPMISPQAMAGIKQRGCRWASPPCRPWQITACLVPAVVRAARRPPVDRRSPPSCWACSAWSSSVSFSALSR